MPVSCLFCWQEGSFLTAGDSLRGLENQTQKMASSPAGQRAATAHAATDAAARPSDRRHGHPRRLPHPHARCFAREVRWADPETFKGGESEADFYASARGSTGTVRPVCREEGGASRRRAARRRAREGVRVPAHRGRSGQRGVDVATVLPTKLKQTCKKNPTSESSGRRTGEWKR